MDLIAVDNYFIEEDEMPRYRHFEKAFPDLKDTEWRVISDGEMNKKIICIFSLWCFDHSLLSYFHEYESYVPGIRQGSLSNSVLTNTGHIEPDNLLEFVDYLAPYFDEKFSNSHYFYDIVSKKDNKSLGGPVFCNINSERVKINTVHTTYSDEVEHKEHYELKRLNSDKPSEWIKIVDGETLDTDNKDLVCKKIFIKDQLTRRIENIKKMCVLAIDLDVKVKRNYEW